MKIDGRAIGSGNPPYTIAEVSCNHGGSLELAKRMVREAKKTGADAVKTQIYTADTLTLNIKRPDFIVQNDLWKGQTLWDLYNKAHTPYEWQKDLYKVAKDEGITIFSSVFDRRGVDLCQSLGSPCIKIASMEIVDTPLIEYAASTGIPLIISTGMASDNEILEARDASRYRNQKAAFLHCTSEYPGTVEFADLSRMSHIDKLLGFQHPVGVSDHTTDLTIPIAATALMATIIEKHFMLGAAPPTEDHEFSLDEGEFGQMVQAVRQTWEAMKPRPHAGIASRQVRRSLYAVADIKKGDIFTIENIRSIRPGYGLPPKMLPSLLGKKSFQAFKKGDPLT